MSRLSGLKIVLILIAIYHVGLGLAGFMSEDLTVRVARAVFGLNLNMTPQLSYIAQLLAVYALVFGLIVAMVARDPVKHRSLIPIVVILYILRVLNKFISMGQFERGFGASMTKVWTDVALLAAFGVAVFLLKPKPDSPREA